VVLVSLCGRFSLWPFWMYAVGPFLCLASRAFQFAIRFDLLCESIRIDSFRKKRPFDSLVVMQFFLLIYCIVSAKKYTTMHAQLKAILCRTSTKNSYAMHTMKIFLTYYLNVSVQAANLSDCRIESKLFLPELECCTARRPGTRYQTIPTTSVTFL